MDKTTYLTGFPATRYKAELEPLAKKRLADMRSLRHRIIRNSQDLKWGSPKLEALIKRMERVDKGIIFWEELLHECK